jgi:hypothetical protein
MKKTLLTIAASTAALSGLHGQNFIAGWDINNYSGAFGYDSTFAAPLNTLDANYSEFDPNGLGAESAAFGTLYADGSFGSTVLETGDFQERPGLFQVQGSPAADLSGNQIARTNSIFFGGGNDNTQLAEGQTTASPGMYFMDDGAAFVLEITPGAVTTDWQLVFGAAAASDPGNFGGSAEVTIEFSTDGVSFSTIDTISVTSDARYESSIVQQASSTGYFRVSGDGLENQGAEGVFIDNLEAVGVVPEPSTYAAIFGAVALGLAAVRRRMKRA